MTRFAVASGKELNKKFAGVCAAADEKNMQHSFLRSSSNLAESPKKLPRIKNKPPKKKNKKGQDINEWAQMNIGKRVVSFEITGNVRVKPKNAKAVLNRTVLAKSGEIDPAFIRQKRRCCEMCQFEFPLKSLPCTVSMKRIMEFQNGLARKKANPTNADKMSASSNRRFGSAEHLYKKVMVCRFCEQICQHATDSKTREDTPAEKEKDDLGDRIRASILPITASATGFTKTLDYGNPTQSSTFEEFEATFAISTFNEPEDSDCSEEERALNNRCYSKTQEEMQPWWQVDFKIEKGPFNEITIHAPQRYKSGSLLPPFWIFVSMKKFGNCTIHQAKKRALCATKVPSLGGCGVERER
jgi:hypothetical protein